MRSKTAWILLIAFAIRALLPPGFMLAAGAGAGVFQVVVCSSQGLKLVSVDENGQPIEHSNQGGDHPGSCAYGPPPVAMTGPAVIDVPHELRFARVSHDRAQSFVLQRSVRDVRFARGPPSTVAT